MAQPRKIMTSFSKGELSPQVEGRPDLAAYFEGCQTLENWLLLRQGGVTRRPGLRFVREVKRSDLDTILLPFEFSVDDAFIVEVGQFYNRFYKNRANILAFSGGPPVEVVNPYTEAQLRALHFTQSADVMWLFNVNHQQRRLSRISDTNWALNAIIYRPPPSFEVDTDISGGATLTPGATTGTSVLFTASAAVFLEGDVGRMIVYGASRAVITGFGASAADTTTPNTKVRADILDDFPDTGAPGPDVLTGWLIRLSPQTTLDPDKKEPVGAQVTLVAGVNAFRAVDLGKFIVIYGGLVKITNFVSATTVKGEILSVMSVTDANPAASSAGAWTLEEASWSGTHGFPRTGEFFQGRLVQAATLSQAVNFWMSASDDFDKYAIGTVADAAVDYLMAARKVNRIEWVADHDDMFVGTAGAEFKIESGKTGEPFGGDIIPFPRKASSEGSAPVQPIVLGGRLIFLDRSRKKIFAVSFSLEDDRYKAIEITGIADHITGTGIKLGPIAFTIRPDPRVYFVREDGELIALTFFTNEKVIGFTHFVTEGTFEAVAVIPQPGGAPDQVWCIVKRTVLGRTVRYVEFFENEATDAVPGPDTTLESTGNGQQWFKGDIMDIADNAADMKEWNSVAAMSVFLSDTTVYKFHTGAAFLRFRRSLDGGVTWSVDQNLSAEVSGPDSFDLRQIVTVVDPADPLPEHLVFIAIGYATGSTPNVWVSRNVLQPNPALSTWSKVALTGTNPLSIGVRGAQVCVVGGNNDIPAHTRIHCSNDFGVTFPNVFLIDPLENIISLLGNQLVVSTGLDTWVVLNPTSASGAVHRTTDNGVTWTKITTLLGAGTTNRGCLLNVDDTILIATVGTKVYRSTDAGLSWAEVATLTGHIVTMGYFGNGIIGGLVDTTFDVASGGSIEFRSEDYGLTWANVPVDTSHNFALGSVNLTPMVVRGPRAVVTAIETDTSVTWYCPSTQISTGPGESIEFADRPWTALQTDSAIVYVSPTPTSIVPGLSHLEGKTVDVVADGAYRGTRVVSMGSISVAPEKYLRFEVGLHYDSLGVTMRPAIEGSVIEGVPRSWDSLYARLKDTVGGKLNGKPIQYPPSKIGTLTPFTGDRKVTNTGWDREGRIRFEQTEPYPMTILALFGTLSLGDHD